MDTLIKTGEENNTDQTQKTPSSNYIESLPADVIFEILVRVPAHDVRDSARLVCRSWYKNIHTRDFKLAHQSTFGLVVDHLGYSRRQHQQMNFIAAAGSKPDDPIEISKLNYHSQHKVLSSCNGLVLAARQITRYLYITNPSTNQNLDLPPFSSDNIIEYGSALGFAAATMEYKVVRSLFHYYKSPDDCVTILTVGVDKDWTRRVFTQHVSLQAKKLLLEKFPLTTQGFVHWARDERDVTWAQYERKCGHVLTLNVETEIITQFPVPSIRSHDIGFSTEVNYLPMGSYLSLLVLRSEFSWELWVMKPETGEWTEMPSIDLEDEFASSRSYILMPVGWLRPREVLVFRVGERRRGRLSRFDSYARTPFCFAFTVRTRKLQKFKLDNDWVNRCLVHRSSLEWIDGC